MSGEQMLIAQKPSGVSTDAGKCQSSPENPGGFTLVELLVVISILVLLMAILLPTLQQVRKQAKGVACQANLRQWGVVFSMYMNEYSDRVDSNIWLMVPWCTWGRRYYADCNDLLLCPMAARYEVNRNDPKWEAGVAGGWGRGSKFAAWKVTWRDLARETVFYGSYGSNLHLPSVYYEHEQLPIGNPSDHRRANTPFFLDCVWWTSNVSLRSQPPAYDGDLAGFLEIKAYCIDRHDGAINSLFMDWSVRKVGLKELWTLKWYDRYDTAGPWTKAGGVQVEDWPEWMRKFRDY